MICQFSPEGLDAESYLNYKSRFFETFSKLAPKTYWTVKEISCLPGIMSQANHEDLLSATNTLLEAGTTVVNAYPRDKRIQRYFDLPADLHELTLKAGQRPYRFHTARPDFVIDRDMLPRFCEINCRFPANGIMASFQLNKASSAVYGVRDPISLDQEMILGPDDGGILALVQKSEIGDEIWDLVEGRPLVTVNPGGLRQADGRIYVGRHPVSKIITELDRSELLDLTPEVRDQIVCDPILLNDMRGQLLIHDKRILAVLWDQQIMGDLMDETKYRQLRPYLIPSFRADDGKIRAALLDQPDDWILKPASGGRGVGSLVGRTAHRDDWLQAIDNGRFFIAQRFIDQSQFDIVYGVEENRLCSRPMTVVGCVPALFGKALGAGILRASNEQIVNVSGGRAIMFGCCLAA